MHKTTLTVPNRAESVRPAADFLVRAARSFGVSRADDPLFEVAISEALTNAVTHGSRQHPDSTITCEIELAHDVLTMRIIDDGRGFAVDGAALPEVSRERLDTLPASGYGLPIIHAVFPVVRVVTVEGRFALELAVPAAT